jgi:general secretion pathway protein C
MDQLLRKYLWIINLISLGLTAFFLASGVGALLSLVLIPEPSAEAATAAPRRPSVRRPSGPVFTARSGDDICLKNIFNYAKRPCAEDVGIIADLDGEGEELDAGDVPPYCTGSSKLVATMASSVPEWAFAMIKASDKTMPYRAGDDVEGLGKIQRVGWRLVLVDATSGPDCLLDLYPPTEGGTVAPSRPTPPTRASRRRSGRGRLSPELQAQVDQGIQVVSANERNVDRALVETLIENSSALMSQARILPYERDGQVQGFKLYGIRRNSLLSKLGMNNGDIIHSIGGIDMTSPDRALEAYSKLRNVGSLSVAYTRRGKRQNLEYNIR